MALIGLTGKKRSGKSTAAAHLADKGFVRVNFKDCLIGELLINFPDHIKTICTTMEKLDYDGNKAWTAQRLVEEKPPLFRTLLQNYGTEVRRQDNEDYWVAEWRDTVTWIDAEHIVADDVRFKNEAQAIRDFGGIIVKIVRTDLEHTDTHASETEMDSIRPDYTISVLTGELDQLHKQLDDIVNVL
jgi:hypothetical protein